MADGIHWNNAAFASLAKSAPVKAAVSKATNQICARANSAAEGHKGAIRLPTSKGGKAVPVSRFATVRGEGQDAQQHGVRRGVHRNARGRRGPVAVPLA